MHLDLDDTVALTRLAAPALDVKAEASGLVPARLGFGQTGKPVADRGERTGVSCGVRPRCASDCPLVDVDHLIQMLEAFDGFAGRGRLAGTVQVHGRGLEQRLDGQRRFTAARHARHTDELPQWIIHRHVLQVIPRGLDHADFLFVAFAPFGRHRNFTLAG